VGKANGSRECAPDDKLRVPTIFKKGGHGASAPLSYCVIIAVVMFERCCRNKDIAACF
jgi:hypothetical protein